MKVTVSFAAVAVTLVLNASGSLAAWGNSTFEKRSTGNGWDLDNKSFDYIIVGGGTAGLVLANRLSADHSNSVAVIEAGDSGYDDNDKFTVPDANLYNSAVHTKYDWQWRTSNQNYMNGRRISWPRGKVLGGSSAVNGLYYVRHSQKEQDAWADLAGGNGHDRWSWGSMLSAMKKSEHFHTPVKHVQNANQVQFDAGSHGHNGPIHTTWPAVTFDPVSAFIKVASKLGAPINKDPYNGRSSGTYLSLSSLSKGNWKRSFSRNAYLDPVADRSNLKVLTGHTVRRVVFDRSDHNNVQATGVQYSDSANGNVHTVHANKEVIISGGSINSPAILQHSGIGEAGLLNNLGIDVVVDLPGVGQNLQDHLSAGMSFKPKDGVNAGPNSVTGNARTDSYVNSAVSYVRMSSIFQDADNMIQKFKNVADNINNGNVPEVVKKGQKKSYSKIAYDLLDSGISPVEILGNVMFNSISIQAALQHPMSRGSIKINSKNPFSAPTIDAGYLTHKIDLAVLREAFKLIRKMSQQSPLKDLIEFETVPGDKVQSNEDWENWIRSSGGTEYHPSCTCSMLPRSEGGVVDTNLKVYGTKNLRVIDASVPPISFSAHLESIVYGIAEIGAEIILGQ